jgi:hypothetical protein
MSPYYFSNVVDEARKQTGWEWIDAHPKMETPPVWQALADEIEQPEEYPAGWWVWPVVALIATVAVSFMANA